MANPRGHAAASVLLRRGQIRCKPRRDLIQEIRDEVGLVETLITIGESLN